MTQSWQIIAISETRILIKKNEVMPPVTTGFIKLTIELRELVCVGTCPTRSNPKLFAVRLQTLIAVLIT